MLAPIACGKRVSRVDPNLVTDLSGRWNDTDSRLVAEQLISQSLNAPWARVYAETHAGQTPPVIIGDFRNETMEHIPVNTFVNELERAYINSNLVRVVANKMERQEIREERADQQQHARAATRARMAQELGAKFMFQGAIQAIEDREGRDRAVYYQVDATLIDLESNLKIWTGQHRIKKLISGARVRM
jgi:hypothetical protein